MRGRIGIILGLFVGLAGCRGEKELGKFDTSNIKPLHVVDSVGSLTDATSGRQMGHEAAAGSLMPRVDVVTGGQGYKNSQFRSESVTATFHHSPGFRGADADYIDKASVYWKLNWIRKQLQSGTLPSNLKEAVKKTRNLLDTVVRDRNFTTADEAVTALEEGIEHLDAQNVLKLGNVDVQLVPWGAGRDAVTRYFDKEKGSRPDSNKFIRRTSGTLSVDSTNALLLSRYSRLGRHTTLVPGVKEAQSLAVSYARKYGASPEEMMRHSWSKAIEKTNKLRDDLGLMHRADNSDRDDVSVPTVFGTSHELGGPDETGDLSDNVVPIPSISGSIRRIDVPASTFKEPADPFANP